MLRVFADDHDLAFSLDDLALLADLLDGWFYLHCPYRTFLAFVVVPEDGNRRPAYFARQVMRPLVRS